MSPELHLKEVETEEARQNAKSKHKNEVAEDTMADKNPNFKKDGQITTFCGGCGTGCPNLDEADPNNVIIRDDFGGSVRLTADQLQSMEEFFVERATSRK